MTTPRETRPEVAPTIDASRANAPTLEAPPSTPTQAPGAVLPRGAAVGRYLVLSLLGRGGMGEVYAAYDPELDRRVAVKILHAARRSDATRRRLVREARALGKLSHPNVVQVYDVGEHGGDVFLAMELVEGESLDVWCKRTPAPGFREILAAYLDAARGLRAAHEKGLVHRDVKPANILRGADGRGRIADFGIAAGDALADGVASSVAPGAAPALPVVDEPSLRETLPAPSGLDTARGSLTQAGAVLGTPIYMAPEQISGEAATPASDQYALCVALHEGLYGVPPFPAEEGDLMKMLLGLRAAKIAGPPPSPPPGMRVPAWVYGVVSRGLAPSPQDRHASMDALLAALEADPEAQRPARRRRVGVAGGAALLLALAAVGWGRGAAVGDPCAHADRELSGVWDDGARARVRAALLDTGRSYAADTASRAVTRLDAYAASYVTMRREVCEAARRGAERREITALRDACLDRRRGQLGALAGVLAERPDTAVLDKAVAAAAGLSPIAYCADVEALTAPVHPPEDPAARARTTALQRRVDQIEALEESGRYREGLALGEPLLAEAAEVGYAPLDAEARYWVARLLERLGELERAKDTLRASAASAAEGRDDALVAKAWARVLFILGERQRRTAEAEVVRTFGPTLRGLSTDGPSRAAWLNAEGLLLLRTGKHADSLAVHERALALNEKAFGPDALQVATSLNNIGLTLAAMGERPRALAALERALAIYERQLGADHPDVALALNNLGVTLFESGDYAAARERYARSAATYERTLGPDHPDGAQAVLNFGNILFVTGDYAGAAAAYARTLAIREKQFGADHPDLALSLSNLAEASFALGEDARAEALALRALAIREKALGWKNSDTASSATTAGRARVRLGRLDEAAALLDRALEAREQALGPKHPDVADTLRGEAELRLARKKPAEAIPLLERALPIADAYTKPEIELLLAETLVASGQGPDRARRLAEDARAAYERLGHRPGLDHASRFLASLPRVPAPGPPGPQR